MLSQVRGTIATITECNHSARDDFGKDLLNLYSARGCTHIRQNGPGIGSSAPSPRQATGDRLAHRFSGRAPLSRQGLLTALVALFTTLC